MDGTRKSTRLLLQYLTFLVPFYTCILLVALFYPSTSFGLDLFFFFVLDGGDPGGPGDKSGLILPGLWKQSLRFKEENTSTPYCTGPHCSHTSWTASLLGCSQKLWAHQDCRLKVTRTRSNKWQGNKILWSKSLYTACSAGNHI